VVEPTVGRHEGVDEVRVEELGVAERVVVDGEIDDRGHSCEWCFVGLLHASRRRSTCTRGVLFCWTWSVTLTVP
jgi:hypothetical protein